MRSPTTPSRSPAASTLTAPTCAKRCSRYGRQLLPPSRTGPEAAHTDVFSPLLCSRLASQKRGMGRTGQHAGSQLLCISEESIGRTGQFPRSCSVLACMKIATNCSSALAWLRYGFSYIQHVFGFGCLICGIGWIGAHPFLGCRQCMRGSTARFAVHAACIA